MAMAFVTIWKAMQAGKEIINPATWKNRQNTSNKIFVLLSLLILILKLFGVDFPISDDDLIIVAGSIASILGVANIVLTTITTKKIGIKPQPEEKTK